MTPEKKPPPFEQMLERIQQIISAMESGKSDLDTLIQQYEEGQRLIAQCQERLTDIERKVEALIKKPDGTLATAPFPEEP
jgi:exodeoxyribonuclease VII small subunit